MVDYNEMRDKWHEKLDKGNPLNNCLVFKQSKLDRFFARTLPYCIPFISKKRRVVIRSYFKHRYARKAAKALYKMMKNVEWEPVTVVPDISKEDYTWEVIAKKENNNE